MRLSTIYNNFTKRTDLFRTDETGPDSVNESLARVVSASGSRHSESGAERKTITINKHIPTSWKKFTSRYSRNSRVLLEEMRFTSGFITLIATVGGLACRGQSFRVAVFEILSISRILLLLLQFFMVAPWHILIVVRLASVDEIRDYRPVAKSKKNAEISANKRRRSVNETYVHDAGSGRCRTKDNTLRNKRRITCQARRFI